MIRDHLSGGELQERGNESSSRRQDYFEIEVWRDTLVFLVMDTNDETFSRTNLLDVRERGVE